MPGVKKEDLEIGVKENVLSIYAERKSEKISESNKEEGDGKENESIVISKYEQRFDIDAKGIDADNIRANLERGVLTVTLPKKEEVKYERRIEVA